MNIGFTLCIDYIYMNQIIYYSLYLFQFYANKSSFVISRYLRVSCIPFYLKNVKISTFLLFSLYLSLDNINPTALNNLSLSTELQGMLVKLK